MSTHFLTIALAIFSKSAWGTEPPELENSFRTALQSILYHFFSFNMMGCLFVCVGAGGVVKHS